MSQTALRALYCCGWLAASSLIACSDAMSNTHGPTGGAASGGGGSGGESLAAGMAGTLFPSTSGSSNATAGVAGTSIEPSGTGGNDDGSLFDPAQAVPFDPNAGGTGGAAPMTGGTGGGVNTDGLSVTSHISGKVNGTAEFTQHGTDVTVVVKLTKCPEGTLGIHINDGASCDNAGTEGKPWDGKRGDIGDTGTISCSQNSAAMTYTRSGADPAMNWTVGDHTRTDITAYVVVVSSDADGQAMSSFIGCGNFFR
jgi:hypothetical protein